MKSAICTLCGKYHDLPTPKQCPHCGVDLVSVTMTTPAEDARAMAFFASNGTFGKMFDPFGPVETNITAPPGTVNSWAKKSKAEILDDIFAMSKAMDEATRGAYPPRGYTFPCVVNPVIPDLPDCTAAPGIVDNAALDWFLKPQTITFKIESGTLDPLFDYVNSVFRKRRRYRVDKLRYRRRVFAEMRYGMRIVEASEFGTRYHRCYPAYLRAAASLYGWVWWWGDADAGWSGNPYER